jgi:hydroxyacylglutathione hydrolase
VPAIVTPIVLGSKLMRVNCYAIATDAGKVLVDTGTRKQRARLESRLCHEGCLPGSVKLILITHGDFDHIGNAAYLRKKLGAPIAMYAGDVPMAAKGDMFAGRKRPNRVVRKILSLAIRVRPEDRFEPDLLVDEDFDLSEYGLPDARVLLLGGHSAGSIGLLLADGSLFCGDVLENRTTPRLGSIMDDASTARASVERISGLGIEMVYPGHGAPFRWQDLEGFGSGPRIR